MSYSEHESLNPERFSEDSSFEAFIDDNGSSITINNCRMTKATSENTEALREFGVDPEVDTIMTLYINGRVFQKIVDGDSIKTVSGHCVFFKLDESDHEEIKYQTQLRIAKKARLFFKESDSRNFHETKFEELTRIIYRPERVATSSSPSSGHETQKIRLFPNKS